MLHGSDIAQQRSAMQLQCTVDIRNRFGVAAYPQNGENIIDNLPPTTSRHYANKPSSPLVGAMIDCTAARRLWTNARSFEEN